MAWHPLSLPARYPRNQARAGGKTSWHHRGIRRRAFGAGHLRVFNPDRAEQDLHLHFTIEVKPPIQGQFSPLSDLDRIEGGDGEDILVGNEHLDRLFGQSGRDVFLGEQVEVRDQEDNEPVRPPAVADRLVSEPPKIIDPLVKLDPDPGELK